jgi:hypothetical protein
VLYKTLGSIDVNIGAWVSADEGYGPMRYFEARRGTETIPARPLASDLSDLVVRARSLPSLFPGGRSVSAASCDLPTMLPFGDGG